MRKLVAGIVVVAALFTLTGAEIRSAGETAPSITVARRPCYGYTIIEFGKGIDCHGDTIQLEKIDGGQQRRRF